MNKQTLQKALLLVISVSAGILISEGLLRLLNPRWADRLNVKPHPKNMYLQDRLLGYRLRPGFEGEYSKTSFDIEIRVDSDGFRDDGNGDPETDDRVVLILGDSFTFGIGVDGGDTFSALLEKELNANGTDVFRVINGGVPGYGTYQEQLLLRETIDRVQPDLVVVAFYPNDLLDNVVHRDSRMEVNEEGYLVRKRIDGSRKPLPGEAMNDGLVNFPFKDFFRGHSALYDLLQKSYRRIYNRIRLPTNWALNGAVDPYEAYSRLGGDYLYLKEENDVVHDLWQDEYDCLDEMIELASSHASKFVLALIPTDNQVYPEPWRDEISWLNLDGRIFDRERVGSVLGRYLDRYDNNVGFLNLTPFFIDRRNDAGSLYYRDGDRHLTPEGHRVVAARLYRYILEGGFLDV